MCQGGQPTCAAHLWLFDEALQALASKTALHMVMVIVLICKPTVGWQVEFLFRFWSVSSKVSPFTPNN